MRAVALALFTAPIIVGVYAYAVYPLFLRLIAGLRRRGISVRDPEVWPVVSISVPVYNEAAQIRSVLDSLLGLDYPPDRRQILVISDASTDGTDELVREYEAAGVELLRMPRRGGKTIGENAGAAHLRGDIVVNTDASIRVHRDALRALVRRFGDSTIGVVSGRDVSVGNRAGDANAGEGGYVDYEMRIRSLETSIGGIVGASGCLYAVRTHLHRMPLPGHLSRDFAAALIAREHGYRAVSADDAICFVPRTADLRREYRRKVRTMSRGMETLHFKAHLLNPFRYGLFAWKLWSHKVCRWLVAPAALMGMLGVAALSLTDSWARLIAVAGAVVLMLAYLGWRQSASVTLPRLLALLAAAAAANVAVLHATLRAVRRDQDATWEPTRRETILPSQLT